MFKAVTRKEICILIHKTWKIAYPICTNYDATFVV